MHKLTPEDNQKDNVIEGPYIDVEGNLRKLDTSDLFENAVKSLDQRVNQLEKVIETTAEPSKYQQKLFDILKRYAEPLRRQALIGSLLDRDRTRVTPEVVGAGYDYATEDEITDQMSGDDTEVIVYGSRDPETHTLLNYMSGKPIPYEDFLQFIYPENPELVLTDVIMPKLDQIQLAELGQLVETGDQAAINVWVQNLCLGAISLGDFDSSAYQALWEMHGQYGSPDIQISDNFWDRENADTRASYANGTIKIPSGNIVNRNVMTSNYFAELSHHVQFEQAPTKNNINYLGDLLGIFRRMIVSRKGPLDSQREEYRREGSVEHEAHSVIEPRLLEEYAIRQREVADFSTISLIRKFYDGPILELDANNSNAIALMISDSKKALLTMEINKDNLVDARRLLEFTDWRGYDEQLRRSIYARPEVKELISNYLVENNLDLGDMDNWAGEHRDIKWFIPKSG